MLLAILNMLKNFRWYFLVFAINWIYWELELLQHLNMKLFKRKENLVEKLEFSIGLINKILRKRDVYQWKSSANFFTTPACIFMAHSKVIQSSHNPRFKCWKHMQIPSKHVVQVWDDFEIFMHTSKGEQINFKFLFIQFTCSLVM